MAITLDKNLLVELGLGSLPETEKESLLSHIYETLETRVGMRLADQMSDAQLEEFEKYFEAKDDAGAFQWLETNFPNYKDIVQDEFNKLKEEVRQTAPQILQASQAQAALPAQPAGYSAAPPVQTQPQPLPSQPQPYLGQDSQAVPPQQQPPVAPTGQSPYPDTPQPPQVA